MQASNIKTSVLWFVSQEFFLWAQQSLLNPTEVVWNIVLSNVRCLDDDIRHPVVFKGSDWVGRCSPWPFCVCPSEITNLCQWLPPPKKEDRDSVRCVEEATMARTSQTSFQGNRFLHFLNGKRALQMKKYNWGASSWGRHGYQSGDD